MLVKDCMKPNPITVRPDSDPLAGIALCKSGGFGRLPVVDEEGQLVGIVTENDLKLFLSTAPSPGVMQRQHRVEQVMSSPVVTVPPEYPIEETAQLMIEHNISGIPVVDQDRRPVGIITHSDVFARFAKALGANTATLRLTVQVPNRLGELAELVLRIAEAGGNICSVVSHCPDDSECLDLTMRVENIQREDLAQAISTHLAAEIIHIWEQGAEEQDR